MIGKRERFFILWLSGISGLGISNIKHLIEHFGSAENVWKVSRRDLKELSWLSETVAGQLLSPKKNEYLEDIVNKMRLNKINFITAFDDGYPELLKEISDHPAVIYIKGRMPREYFINISIIGTRHSTNYGLEATFKLSRDLAGIGFVIVSGMARGIDSKAHMGALDARGKTIAVLGNGLDICYPSENKGLMEQIAENGCIISEYPPGVPPYSKNFPARNRIISGLSRGLIVVEAAEKSGTNITVNYALNQGREVFAVPGSIFSELSKGTNRLIKEGANIITDYKDVLNVLGIDIIQNMEHNTINKNIHLDNKNKKKVMDRAAINDKIQNININKNKDQNNVVACDLSDDEKIIFDLIGNGPTTVDEIIVKTGKDVGIVQYCLTSLEYKNLASRQPGQKYVRVSN